MAYETNEWVVFGGTEIQTIIPEKMSNELRNIFLRRGYADSLLNLRDFIESKKLNHEQRQNVIEAFIEDSKTI